MRVVTAKAAAILAGMKAMVLEVDGWTSKPAVLSVELGQMSALTSQGSDLTLRIRDYGGAALGEINGALGKSLEFQVYMKNGFGTAKKVVTGEGVLHEIGGLEFAFGQQEMEADLKLYSDKGFTYAR